MWKHAAKRAVSACDALGLRSESSALTYARSLDTLRRAATKAEERAIAIEASARFVLRTTIANDSSDLCRLIALAASLTEACADVHEAIESREMETA